MSRHSPAISISRWLVYCITGLSALLFLFQLLMQNYFVEYVGGIYQANIGAVMERTASEVQNTFTTMNNAVEYIADDPNVQEYAQIQSTALRYQRAFDSVRPIIRVATQNLGFDHVLVSDVSGAWFRFEGSLSIASCQKLKQTFAETWTISNTIQTLDGVPYYCTVKPLLTLQNGKPAAVGLVVALTDVGKTRSFLRAYGEFQDISIVLHDFETVLISNLPEQEGVSLDSLNPRGELYTRVETILPHSLEVLISIPHSKIFPHQMSLIIVFIGVGLFSILMVLLMALFINRLIVRPITHVMEDARRLGDRDLSRRLTITGVEDVDNLVGSINSMLARLEDYSRRVFITQQNLYELEISAQESQMYLLRNQINRHFLYNSLISIKSLADRGENKKVEEVAGGIAQLLRFATSQVKEVNIFEEMEIVRRYVNIQNIRFDNKITFTLDVDDRLCDYKIPRLILQPLVENALIHGLEKKRSGCMLHLRGYLEDESIRIEVEDNGAGIPADQLTRIQQNIADMHRIDIHHGLEGVALANIQKRISLAYGSAYRLQVSSEAGRYTLAVLNLPAVLDTPPQPL